MPAAEALSATLGAFGLFSPGLTQARRSDPENPADRFDVRTGQILGVAASLAVVALIARQDGNLRPFMFWGIGALTIVGLHELALRDRSDVGA